MVKVPITCGGKPGNFCSYLSFNCIIQCRSKLVRFTEPQLSRHVCNISISNSIVLSAITYKNLRVSFLGTAAKLFEIFKNSRVHV